MYRGIDDLGKGKQEGGEERAHRAKPAREELVAASTLQPQPGAPDLQKFLKAGEACVQFGNVCPRDTNFQPVSELH